MNKDLERARRELEERETQKMMEAINANHEQAYNKWLLNQQVKKITKEKKDKKEIIVNFVWVVLAMIILATLMGTMLIWLAKDNQEFVNECTASGYRESYCRSQL